MDITALQPRRANWDLKRDIQEKLDLLDRRTDVAINKIVKERLGKLATPDKERVGPIDFNKEVQMTEKLGYGVVDDDIQESEES